MSAIKTRSLKGKAQGNKFSDRIIIIPKNLNIGPSGKDPSKSKGMTGFEKAIDRAQYEQQMIKLNQELQEFKKQHPGPPKRKR